MPTQNSSLRSQKFTNKHARARHPNPAENKQMLIEINKMKKSYSTVNAKIKKYKNRHSGLSHSAQNWQRGVIDCFMFLI
jgi:hypothetical protein